MIKNQEVFTWHMVKRCWACQDYRHISRPSKKEVGRCLQDSAGGLVKTVIKEFRRLGEDTLSSFSDM